MNVPHDLPAQYATHRRLVSIKWLVPMVVIPIAGFAVYVGWLLFSEYRAHQSMNARMTSVGAASSAPTDAWLAKRFAETASREGTAAWSEITALSSSVGWSAINDLPIIGNGKSLRTLEVGVQWQQHELVDQYLKEARPLLELIYQAEKYPTPVWQPIDFRGFNTMLPELQESRQIARILQLDFEQAIIGSDPVRAMRDLQAMQNTADAFDWDLFIVGELVNMALRSMRYSAIQRSLFANVWTEADLERLIEHAQRPLPLAQSWRRSLESEKALGMNFMQSPLYSPHTRLLYLERFTQLEALAESPAGQFAIRYRELDAQLTDKQADPFIPTMLQPAFESYAAAFDRLERSRRLVLTSLAVKLFQLKHARWPENLQELEQVGLRSGDWTLPAIGPLGYAVQADGQTACVWGVPDGKSLQDGVAQNCPDHSGEKLEKVGYYVTVIK